MSIAERTRRRAPLSAVLWLCAAVSGLLLPAVAAHAQNRVSFSSRPQDAVRVAREHDRPLMLYVVGRDWEDMEDAHARTFRNDEVIAASRRFVAARLIRSQHRDLATQWGLGKYAHDIVFTTPDGNLLDIAPSWTVASPRAFIEKMRAAFDRYREHVYIREIAPVLEQEEPDDVELRRALNRVENLIIYRADGPIEKLLKRAKLDDGVKAAAFDALAALSTAPAVKVLMRYAQDAPAAAAALGECTPAAADEFILPHLTESDLDMRMIALDALGKICGIRMKPRKFWESEHDRLHRDEIERVRRLVRETADRWRARNEYR